MDHIILWCTQSLKISCMIFEVSIKNHVQREWFILADKALVTVNPLLLAFLALKHRELTQFKNCMLFSISFLRNLNYSGG